MPTSQGHDDPPDDDASVGARERGRLMDRCVSVIVGGSLYGIPIQYVQEIIGARPLTKVFRVHPCVAGVTSLRGEILAVLDLAALIGLPMIPRAAVADPASDPSRIVVVREEAASGGGPPGQRRRAGFRVDALGPVRDLPMGVAALDPPPHTVDARTRPYLRGVISEPPLCAVLDVTQLLDAPELATLAGRAAAEPT